MLLGYITVIVAYLIWGAAPPIFKWALQDIPPFALAFIRFAGASIIFLPFLFKQDRRKVHVSDWKHIVLGGLWGVAINVGAFFIGLEFAPSINVHIINSMSPLLLYMLSIYILKEKPHAQIVKGMLIACVGVLIIVLAPLFDGAKSSLVGPVAPEMVFLGNMLFVAAVVGGVLITVHNKLVSKKISPFFITEVQFIVGALVFLPFMLVEQGNFNIATLTMQGWIGIVFGMVFSSALAYAAMNYGIQKIPAQDIGVLTYMMPVVAVLVAIPLLGEVPDIFFVIGTVVVAIGIVISERRKRFGRKT
ncbi:DMT family transporter [Candidatus Woesebacteria bacterium]|nr:DMT family transporter [Candidatus Woesebacteria bacterium]